MTLKQTRLELEASLHYNNAYIKYSCIPKIEFAISRIKNEKHSLRLAQIKNQIEQTEDPFDFNKKVISNSDLSFITRLINEAISIIEIYE